MSNIKFFGYSDVQILTVSVTLTFENTHLAEARPSESVMKFR